MESPNEPHPDEPSGNGETPADADVQEESETEEPLPAEAPAPKETDEAVPGDVPSGKRARRLRRCGTPRHELALLPIGAP